MYKAPTNLIYTQLASYYDSCYEVLGSTSLAGQCTQDGSCYDDV